jgi:hypothetical protein
MIKTAISIAIIALVLWGGYTVWQKYETYNTNKDQEQKQSDLAAIDPNSLPGMPQDLMEIYKKAAAGSDKGDPRPLGNFLKQYHDRVDDPRRAWIEMDYMLLISKSDVQEAKRIFADVKGRTSEDSPIRSRIKQLEKTYE